jgi:hypothetical protein
VTLPSTTANWPKYWLQAERPLTAEPSTTSVTGTSGGRVSVCPSTEPATSCHSPLGSTAAGGAEGGLVTEAPQAARTKSAASAAMTGLNMPAETLRATRWFRQAGAVAAGAAARASSAVASSSAFAATAMG